MSSPQNQISDPFVTQSVLKAELKVVRTEMQELASELAATILAGVQRMFDEQNRKNDLKFATKGELNEFKEEFMSFKRENTASMAEVMGELKAIREEQVIGGYRQTRHSDQLENHERRLRVVETQLRIADK